MRSDERTADSQEKGKERGADRAGKGTVTVCGASAYEEKYYLNPVFARMPRPIRDELQIICVMFTQDVGGVFTLEMDADGKLQMRTESRGDDFSFDEIGSVLRIKELQRTKSELFRSLELYYSLIVRSDEKENNQKKTAAKGTGSDL